MAKHEPPIARKPRLGRGLSALIVNSSPDPPAESRYVPTPAPGEPPHGPSPTADGPSRAIPVTQIAPNPYQPRQDFSPDELATLAHSITTQGLLQPLVVCPATDHAAGLPYVLIAGERRLRAARQAGLETVPCLIRAASPMQMLEWALVENIHRADLNPIERAHAYHEYIERFDLTQAQAADKLGLPRATIANYLRLLDLCDEVQTLLVQRALTFGHAKVLAGLVADPASQCAIASKVAAESLSVRQTERLVAAARNGRSEDPDTQAATAHGAQRAPYLADLEERLCQAVGTRVRILPGRTKHSGRIVVEYYSLDDFDRISAALGLRTTD